MQSTTSLMFRINNLLRDHLGNITHQVNTSNTVVAEFSFDAWGRRRNASNWTYTLDANDKALFADRGFTGHEYLPWYKLYNMNGRLYDPAVGRFLSADPVVQDPQLIGICKNWVGWCSFAIRSVRKMEKWYGDRLLGG